MHRCASDRLLAKTMGGVRCIHVHTNCQFDTTHAWQHGDIDFESNTYEQSLFVSSSILIFESRSTKHPIETLAGQTGKHRVLPPSRSQLTMRVMNQIVTLSFSTLLVSFC
jgi:hypothetical protein